MNKIIIALMLFGMFAMPFFSMAQNAPTGFLLVPCKGDVIPGTNTSGSAERACEFGDFMAQVDRVITVLLYVAVMLSIISFMYAGFRLLFAGGNEDALKHAKHIFWSVIVGLVFTYGAWAIVHFFVTSLGVKQDYTLLK